MRAILLIFILYCALSNTTLAVESTWTGYHVSLSANSSRSDEDPFVDIVVVEQSPLYLIEPQKLDYSATGLGIEGGYLYEFHNGWVIGADLKYETLGVTDGNNSLVPEIPGFETDELPVGISVDRTFSFRPKLGYAIKNVLFYVGPEYVRSELSLKRFYQDPFLPLSDPKVKASATHVAWTGGIDWRFSNNWSVGLDYRKAPSFGANFDIDLNSYLALYLSRPVTDVTRYSYRDINYEQCNIRVSYHF